MLRCPHLRVRLVRLIRESTVRAIVDEFVGWSPQVSGLIKVGRLLRLLRAIAGAGEIAIENPWRDRVLVLERDLKELQEQHDSEKLGAFRHFISYGRVRVRVMYIKKPAVHDEPEPPLRGHALCVRRTVAPPASSCRERWLWARAGRPPLRIRN